MNLSKFIALLVLVLMMVTSAHASSTTHTASTTASKAGTLAKSKAGSVAKTLKGGNALSVAVNLALAGAGWIMDEGTKVNKTTDTDHSGNASGAGAAAGAGGADTSIPAHGAYPYEFIFDGKSFPSAAAAHAYAIGPYLRSRGLIRSRDEEGLFYDKLDVYYGTKAGYGGGVGYFATAVRAAPASSPPSNLIGGSTYVWTGSIFYKGTKSIEQVHVSDSYAKDRDKARQLVQDALQSALPADDDYIPVPVPKPGEKDTPKPVVPPIPNPNNPAKPDVDIPNVPPANDPVYDPPKPGEKDTPKENPKETPNKETPEKDAPKVPPVPTKPDTDAPPVTIPVTPPSVPANPPITTPNDPSVKPVTPTAPTTNPSGQPKPNPVGSPQGNPNGQPNPQGNPNPNGQSDPQNQPNPSGQPNPNGQTNPQGSPNPNGQANPNGQPNPNTPTPPNGGGQTPFELPAFCDWAKPVCDFIKWFKDKPPDEEPPQQLPKLTLEELGLEDNTKSRLNFSGTCPQKTLEFTFNGHHFAQPIPMHHYCRFLETLAPFLVGFTWLSCAIMIIRSL